MNLVDYLKMRRQVEQAPPNVVKDAQELAEILKKRNTELITTDQMWDALIQLAEEKSGQTPEYQFRIVT